LKFFHRIVRLAVLTRKFHELCNVLLGRESERSCHSEGFQY
jgi:hypothetical protein